MSPGRSAPVSRPAVPPDTSYVDYRPRKRSPRQRASRGDCWEPGTSSWRSRHPMLRPGIWP